MMTITPNKTSVRGYFFAAVFLWMVVVSFSALADLKVFSTHWPPYVVDDEPLSGLAVNVVQRLLQYSGLSYRMQLLPWKRGYNEVLISEETAIFPVVRTQEREDLFKWVGPILKIGDFNFYSLSEKHIDIHNLREALKYRIGVRRGGVEHAFLISEGFREDSHFYTVAKQEQAVRMLLVNHVDLIIESDIAMVGLLDEMKILRGSFRFSGVFMKHSGYLYLALNKNTNQQKAGLLQESAEQLWQDGFVDHLVAGYCLIRKQPKLEVE